ncbi:hypothetical protein BH10BAC3_BH10BAC3_13020 [soil metagenome]
MFVKFTDILITKGQDFLSPDKQVKMAETVSIVKACNINYETILFSKEKIGARMLDWVGREIINGNHILFAKPIQKHSNTVFSSTTKNNDIVAINDLAIVLPKFLYYYLYLKKNQLIVTNKKGSRFSKDKLSKLIVPIPNLVVQKNMVYRLKHEIESTETAAKNIQKEIDNLIKENTQMFSKCFKIINRFLLNGKLPSADTKIMKICEAGLVQAGKTPNGSIRKYFGDEYPFYNQTAFDQGMNILFSTKHLSARGIHEARLFKENSILVCFIGAQLGMAGIARNSGACNSQMLSITTFDFIQPDFLYYQIVSDAFQSQMRKFSTNLAISKSDFENLLVEVPPIKKQEEIISCIKNHLVGFDKKLSELSAQLLKNESKQLEVFSSLLSERM